MALVKTVLLFYTVYLIQGTHCCWEAENNVIYCNTFLELSMEGGPDWEKVSVKNVNNEPLHTLQANSFEKVRNIEVLEIVAAINGIEPGAFKLLNRLRTLKLVNNEITDLPAKIFKKRSLQVVLLSNNNITGIPPDSFKKIKYVKFSNNSIGEIKANMFNNSLIRVFDLDRCDIEVIEDGSFMRMKLLYFLALTRNMLTSFNVKRLFGNSSSLEVLYVDFNRLTNVPRDMFDGAEKLYIISLEGNHIESIEDGAFSRLQYLGLLDLSENRLVQVQPQILQAPRQPSLKVLSLHNNRLTFINLALLARAYRLVYFSYGGNPIQCPCSDGIKDYLSKQNIELVCFDNLYYSGNYPTCVVPLEHADMCLYDVDLRNDLYEYYKVVRQEYAILQRNCNISKSAIKDIYEKGTRYKLIFKS